MISVVVTQRARRILRSGEFTRHKEAWMAESTDGAWTFERIDGERGTPWQATHRDVPGWSTTFGTLSKARKGAAPQLAFDFCRAWITALGLERPRRPARIFVG
jgi:hypothetical protein